MYQEVQRFSHFWAVDSNIGKHSANVSKVAFQQVQSGRLDLRKFDPDLRDDHGNTLLHYACFYGCNRAIKQLALKPGLNQRNKYGRLPIWWAVQRGKLDAALWLLDSLANLDLGTSAPDTAGLGGRHPRVTVWKNGLLGADLSDI
jgi:ankyrin repeat protein